MQLYRDAHGDHIRALDRARYVANHDHELEVQRLYAAAHRKEKSAQNKAWRQRNPEYRRNYEAANRDRVRAFKREQNAKWRASHPDYRRNYVANNRLLIRALNSRAEARRRGAAGSHTLQEWLDKCALLGNVCIYCGEARPLERDHNVPPSRGGSDSIENILPACRSCNSAKHDKTAREFLGLAA